MAYLDRSWWPKGLNRWGFDPRKPMAPQVASAAAQMSAIFGGPLLGLYMIEHYPALVPDRVLAVAMGGLLGAWFAASFVLIPNRTLPPRLPLSMNLMYRLGLGLGLTFWTLGIAGIANGWNTPLFVREAPVVAKHRTLARDPAHRTYYVSTRPWPGSRQVQDLDAPLAVYQALEVPISQIGTPGARLEAMPDAARVRLVLGRGRLGADWLKTVEAGRPGPG